MRFLILVGLAVVGAVAQSDSSSTPSTLSTTTSSGSSSRSSSGKSSSSSSSQSATTTAATTDYEASQYSYASIGPAQPTGGSTRFSTTGTSSGSSTTSLARGTTSIATVLVGGANGGIVTQSVINGTVTLSSHLNATATTGSSSSSTSTSATPTNTQPCNNYVEFCDRKYGNITEVCAHNSAFDIKGNGGSNQQYGITTQLDDGIRMIQGETHYVNGTIRNCHTSCDLLDAGPWVDELRTVADWVEDHPFDVVTILIVNSDLIDVRNYTAPLQASGLGPYLYEPPLVPMRLDDWPTLSELILSQKRVIVFMDYKADQAAVPYILDEFTHMWETPFSPTNRSFPCTTQRPPNLNQTLARDGLMYLANHNLNTELSILGTSLLLPNTAEINVTNAAGDQYGMLGAMSDNCTADWGRPPNWLLVDYYNVDGGSVFEVAAKANNVTYNRKCCGVATSSGSKTEVWGRGFGAVLAAAGVVLASLWM